MFYSHRQKKKCIRFYSLAAAVNLYSRELRAKKGLSKMHPGATGLTRSETHTAAPGSQQPCSEGRCTSHFPGDGDMGH